MKLCSRCKQYKSLDMFSRMNAAPDGHQAWCKQCQRESRREWKNKPGVKERLAKYMRVYRSKDE